VTGYCLLKDWIIDQLRQSTAPIHSVMVELLEAFARSCIPSSSSSSTKNLNVPLDETALMVSDNCLEIIVYSLIDSDTFLGRSVRRKTDGVSCFGIILSA